MQNDGIPGRWVFCPRPNPQAKLRLYCFPFAGGAAHAYTNWTRHLPGSIELRGVQLPGRGPRISEPLLDRLDPLLEAVLAALEPEWTRHPFALYGHSMGGVMAYELAHRLRESGGPQPVAVAISGRAAPQVGSLERKISTASDDDVWRELQSYNGTSDELLQDPETRRVFLPIVRADFAIVENHVHRPRSPLNVPLQISIGIRDAATPPGSEAAWLHETTAACQVRRFLGDHFFIRSDAAAFVTTLGADLETMFR